ncbi:DUF2306 domain-containing protein [Paenibacillus doosanensis]|uniref:DUF2306 domain-containing protein n=1 Tax=Paenibacillus konkukensis TaxID=2020716 RepID=A0ABY4RPL4_9BACL|nr:MULTISPECIES: DUF2306 domain-containing protein [Paenibacillus]MCS7459081.1 DUF2306 domain-containing protein [Paenibacillus doosanensis]UQZ84135.1 hypothetical protein SK3146_03368 [Paenibacillus konkukensis]
MNTKAWVRIAVSLLALLLIAYVVMQYGLSDPKKAGLIVQKLREPNFHYFPWIVLLYGHIVTACLAVILGPLQLFIRVQGTWVRYHRMLGYLYVAAITFSGLISIYLSLFATGGWKAGLGFFTLDVLWVTTTWIGVKRAVNRQITAHKQWMIRSYALTLAAVSFRVWLMVFSMLTGWFVQSYQLSAWACWIGNLIVAELIILYAWKKTRTAVRAGRTY